MNILYFLVTRCLKLANELLYFCFCFRVPQGLHNLHHFSYRNDPILLYIEFPEVFVEFLYFLILHLSQEYLKCLLLKSLTLRVSLKFLNYYTLPIWTTNIWEFNMEIKPRVLLGLIAINTHRDIHSEEFLNQVFSFPRYCSPLSLIKSNNSPLYQTKYL